MADTLEFPTRDSMHVLENEVSQPGKNKIPFRLELSAEQYSNNAETRANGGSQLIKIILPPPTEGFGNDIIHAYNQAPAKEEALLTKAFSGEGTSLFRDFANFVGKQIQDARTTFLGQDFGRIPADMSESTYGGSNKRVFTFTWELMALSKKDSNQIMKIGRRNDIIFTPRSEKQFRQSTSASYVENKSINQHWQWTRSIDKSNAGKSKGLLFEQVSN